MWGAQASLQVGLADRVFDLRRHPFRVGRARVDDVGRDPLVSQFGRYGDDDAVECALLAP